MGRGECVGSCLQVSESLWTHWAGVNEDAELWFLLCKSRTSVIVCLDAQKQELFGELDRSETLWGSCAGSHGH